MLAAFLDVGGVCFKAESIVQYESEVFVTFHHLDCFATDADRVVGGIRG